MSFTNPIVGGNNTLIRDSIHSPDYVAGVSGWSINQDGTAEFNNVTARGSVVVTGTNGASITMSVFSGGTIFFQAEPYLSTNWAVGQIAGYGHTGGTELGGMILTAPSKVGNDVAQIILSSEDEVLNPASIELYGDTYAFNNLYLTGNINWGANPSISEEGKDSSVTNGTTTSTTFTNTLTTAGVRGIDFVAPPSGRVFVIGGAGGYNNTANQFTLLDFEIRTGATIGSGTIVRSGDENSASQYQSTVANAPGQHAVSGLVTGLTPGSAYNVALVYRVTANTGNYNRRKIAVLPAL